MPTVKETSYFRQEAAKVWNDAGLVLLTVYAKSVDDNLSAAFLRRLAALEG